MAADNRNFVNKFANEGGGDVLVEDKRLEELKSATAKTAAQISTTTDYIPLQDTDGNLVKINPASFEEAVRKTLGSLLANNDKGTTISGVPALSGSGASLDFGSVTPANLASVLGAVRTRMPANSDFNNYTTIGNYFCDSTGQVSTMGNKPAELTKDYIMEVRHSFISNLFVSQTVYSIDGKVFYRFNNGGSWTSWGRSDGYGCGTASDLASLLGVGDIKSSSAEVLKIRRTEEGEAAIAFYTETNTKLGIISITKSGVLRFYDKDGTSHTISYT